MAKFQLSDGHKVEVHNAQELIEIMHANSLTEAADDKAYMMDVVERAKMTNGAIIRTSSAEAFVNDLIKAGLLEIVP